MYHFGDAGAAHTAKFTLPNQQLHFANEKSNLIILNQLA